VVPTGRLPLAAGGVTLIRRESVAGTVTFFPGKNSKRSPPSTYHASRQPLIGLSSRLMSDGRLRLLIPEEGLTGSSNEGWQTASRSGR